MTLLIRQFPLPANHRHPPPQPPVPASAHTSTLTMLKNLYKIIDKLNSYKTPDLLHLIKCEHYLPHLEEFFEKYQLGRLWDHLPAVLFFYLVFAFASGIGRQLSSLLLKDKLAQLDKKARKKLKISWAHHIVAFLNAIISSSMALHYILFINKDKDSFTAGTHDYFPEVARILSVGVGYFIWDVQICIKYYSIYGAAFALHGVMALVALVISFKPYMMNLISYYMLVEISTIFLHTNWFLIKLGYKNTLAFKISHGLLLTSYFCIRVVMAPYFVYETIRQTLDANNHTALWAKTVYCGNVFVLALLSQFWFWKLAYSTFFSEPKKTKKD